MRLVNHARITTFSCRKANDIVNVGVLPRDAAAAMAQQIVAESQHRDAAATLAAKPKPKARIRGVTRAPTAAEAAVAAAAAATSGLLDSIPAPAKASRKIAQGLQSIISACLH